MEYKLLRAFRTICVYFVLLSMIACQPKIVPTSSEDTEITNKTLLSTGSVVTTGIGGGKSNCPPGWVEESPGVCSNYHAGTKVCPPRFNLTVFVTLGSEIIERVVCCPAGIKHQSDFDCVGVKLCGRSRQPRFVEQDGNIIVSCCRGKGTEDCEEPGKTPRPRGR